MYRSMDTAIIEWYKLMCLIQCLHACWRMCDNLLLVPLSLVPSARSCVYLLSKVSIKGPELLTMWFGESEANVREVFDKAGQRGLSSLLSLLLLLGLLLLLSLLLLLLLLLFIATLLLLLQYRQLLLLLLLL